MSFHKWLSVVSFWLSFVAFAFAEEPLDLHQAIQVAIENNPRMQVLLGKKAVAQAEVQIAQQFNNPSLSAETTRSQPNYFAGAGYAIELGGKRGKRTEVARSGAEVAQLEYRLGMLALRHAVRVSFYSVLQSRSKKQEVAVSRDLAQRLLEISRQRFEAGAVARLEVLTAELELKQRDNDLRQAETEEQSAMLQLNLLLNHGAQDSPVLKGSLEDRTTAPPLDSLVADASSKHLDLQSLEQQIKGEQANLALARATRIPDLETEAGTEIHDADFQYGWRFGLRFELPLLNRKGGEIQRSTAALQELQAEELATRRQILADVSSAYLKYQGALFQADNYHNEILPESTELVDLAEESYKEGHTGILSVLEAQRAGRQVRLGYLDVLLQYQTAVADLEQASGVELP